MIRTALICLALMVWAPSAQACRLALVLAMDVSSSVNAEEDTLQRQGMAAALVAPQVQAAFFATDEPVALAVFEWSGRYNQLILQDWVLVDSPQRLHDIASRVSSTPRSHSNYPTALGHAVGFASTMLQRAPICDAQTVDVSGDGPNNDGFGTDSAYAAFPFDAVTINGLVINVIEDMEAREAQFDQDDLVSYYTRNVIRGPGAFVQTADGFEDFARAMEVKLIRELGVRVIGQLSEPSRTRFGQGG